MVFINFNWILESKEGIDFISVVILGSLGMLTLASFIVVFVLYYQKRMLANKTLLQTKETEFQRQLLDASIEVAEEERKKIAGNIHDDVGMTLNVIKLNFSKIKRNIDDKDLTLELIEANHKILEDSITTLRAISHDLMPPTLSLLGLIKGLKELCRQMDMMEGVDVSYESNDITVRLNKKIELQIYRLIKELLNNIIKHSNASTISVISEMEGAFLITKISHNGKGITNKMIKDLIDSGKGIGLKSIQSRAQLTNSELLYFDTTDNSPKIILRTPII